MFPSLCVKGIDSSLEGIKLLTPGVNKNNAEAGDTNIKTSSSFGEVVDLVTEGLNKVNHIQKNAEGAVEDLVTGKANNLHEVVIAIQEANIAFQFAVKTRNKIVEAYQEVMRMQV